MPKHEQTRKCKICCKLLSRESCLVIHMRTHTGERPYKCPYCVKCFTTPGDSKRHLRTHTGEKQYKCDICSMGFAHLTSFKWHKQSHSGEKPFRCQECNRDFARPDYLKRHARTHKLLGCNHCAFKSKSSTELNHHIRVHTGAKPYSTSFRWSTCRSPNSLSKPRADTEERPYKCDYCPWKFKRSSHLKDHVRVHTGEKPYKCTFCDVECIRFADLNMHIRVHTGEKPYKCELCSSEFKTSSDLCRHFATHVNAVSQKGLKAHTKTSPQAALSHVSVRQQAEACETRKQSSFNEDQPKCKKQSYAVGSIGNHLCKCDRELKLGVPAENVGSKSSTSSSNQSKAASSSFIEFGSPEKCEDIKAIGFETHSCKICGSTYFTNKELCVHYTLLHNVPKVLCVHVRREPLKQSFSDLED